MSAWRSSPVSATRASSVRSSSAVMSAIRSHSCTRTFFTYCWAMEEPPCVSRPVAVVTAARTVPWMSMPP